MNTITLDVKGMSCNHCVNAIEGALEKVKGVSHSKVDLSAHQVTVSFDDTVVAVETIKETIEDQGYDIV